MYNYLLQQCVIYCVQFLNAFSILLLPAANCPIRVGVALQQYYSVGHTR